MDVHNMKFAASGEYPNLERITKNNHYAKMMLDNYGGIVSEMSAVSLYTYNNIHENKHKPHISYIFNEITIVEMKHLYIFGELADQLGEKPILRYESSNRYVNWSPSFNKYPNEFLPLIKNSLNLELEAIKKYTYQIHKINDEILKKCLERIIEDEKVHMDIFKEILKTHDW